MKLPKRGTEPPPPARPSVPPARPLGGALGDGAVDEDVPGQARRHGQGRRDDGAHLCRALPPPSCQFRDRPRASWTSGVGGPANPGVPCPCPDRSRARRCRRGSARRRQWRPGGLHGQVEVGAPQPTAHVRLPDARDDGPPLQRLLGRTGLNGSSTGVNSGSQTSSACSKSTRTGMPIRTSSGSTSTRFVERRTSGCSSIEPRR